MQPVRPRSKSKATGWPSPSHVAVFIRNLKLLQLDQLDDWPDITTRALSSSQQNQRQRIKCVEWALYRLFAIWDPEGTQNKLRPFFPPLEPLQSLNLRAALFRALSDLKKNGDLGRETILRKSMLDDCRGDKFEEVLAVFSTLVLRKVLAARSDLPASVAMRLATARGISEEEHQMMVPLILAHQYSLGTLSECKTRVQSNYDKFTQLLDTKKDELSRRSKDRPQPSEQDREQAFRYESIVREVKGSWLGSEEWADALLYGGVRSSKDGFLELPFLEAWSRANRGTVDDLSNAPATDLLVELENRISRQQARLRKWREFNESMQKSDPQRQAQRESSSAQPLVFREHQRLTVASISKAVRQPTTRTRKNEEYQSLLSSLHEDLSKLKGKVNLPGAPTTGDVSAPEDDHRDKGDGEYGAAVSFPPPVDWERLLQSPSISVTKPDHEDVESHRSIPPADHVDMPPSTHEAPPVSECPVDRMSQEQNPKIDTPEEPDLPPLPTPKPKDNESPLKSTSTLLERTRQSLSLLPPPSARPREKQPRKPRPSFPVNQFEAPDPNRTLSPPPEPVARASTPMEQLFEQDADYASVFKSRPRIATSPMFSPAVHVDPVDDVSDVDIDEDDERDMSFNENLMSSPLVRSKMRR
ncbi:hypothetical protein VTN00DRAFT_43 [Thermoascus crustaceus]|uniref:uncharacterized protein n=1 Tax=Thermoascus crustaceus TaxID=5088 RepID=UPI0037449C14